MMDIPERILLGPGPSNTPPRVLAALARPTLGHLDPVFVELMNDTRDKLRRVFKTENELTLPVSGTGSAGMETLLVNLIEPGDRVLVGVNGVFGERMKDLAQRLGADVHALEVPWGSVFARDDVAAAIERVKPKIVALVHAETSTGAHQPVAGLGEMIHRAGALFLLDCVTSLAGAPVEIDAWEVDAAFSGTQKCLSCPPGLSPVTLSERAWHKIQARARPVPSFYFDLSLVKKYWGEERFYHHTAPVNMLYGLNEALTIALEEGLERRHARHRATHIELKHGLRAMGMHYLSQEGYDLPMLNAVEIPEGVDDAATRKRLLMDYGIEVGGGLGAFKGKAFRIGLMGHGATRRNVRLLLSALEDVLPRV